MKGTICQSAIADRRRARAAGLDCKDFCIRRRGGVLRGMGELLTSQPVHRTHVHDDPLHLGRHKKTACAWSIGALLEATSRIGPCDVGARAILVDYPRRNGGRAGVAGMVWFEDEGVGDRRWSASIAPRGGPLRTGPDGCVAAGRVVRCPPSRCRSPQDRRSSSRRPCSLSRARMSTSRRARRRFLASGKPRAKSHVEVALVARARAAAELDQPQRRSAGSVDVSGGR